MYHAKVWICSMIFNFEKTCSVYEKPKHFSFAILSAAKNLVVLMNSGILHFVQDDST
jgi:hypothetical protein